MELLPLIIQLISGAAGGNIAGALFKNISLGTLWNSVAGVAGGGLGGVILSQIFHIAPGAGGPDLISILTSVASSGVGGGGLMAVIGLVRSMMAK